MGKQLGLILTFIFVIWQAMGGGLTGTAWQSMIAKIMPSDWRGTFYGAQSAAANLLSSGGAVLAGVILRRNRRAVELRAVLPDRGCRDDDLAELPGFDARAGIAARPRNVAQHGANSGAVLGDILRRDTIFRLFIGARMLAQIASVGLAFFTVYAVQHFTGWTWERQA